MTEIPRLNAAAFDPAHPDHAATLEAARHGATDVGFLTVHNTALTPERVRQVIAAYRAFFALPTQAKAPYDMARTGSNRGWGAPGSEQVDPDANPDYKQVFDCGYHWPGSPHAVYAPNVWPDKPDGFRTTLKAYYADALTVAGDILRGICLAIGADPDYFARQFDRPMALLRGNFYPERPAWAGARDFGIATHTDYGCVTLLATDGTPGLEVRQRGGGWLPVTADPGEFIINFGDMLALWTGGKIVATPHRVIGSTSERISVPLFYNPRYDTNVAPDGADPILAGDHLTERFNSTYLHLTKP